MQKFLLFLAPFILGTAVLDDAPPVLQPPVEEPPLVEPAPVEPTKPKPEESEVKPEVFEPSVPAPKPEKPYSSEQSNLNENENQKEETTEEKETLNPALLKSLEEFLPKVDTQIPQGGHILNIEEQDPTHYKLSKFIQTKIKTSELDPRYENETLNQLLQLSNKERLEFANNPQLYSFIRYQAEDETGELTSSFGYLPQAILDLFNQGDLLNFENIQTSLLEKVNQLRKSHDLESLTLSEELLHGATLRALEQANFGFLRSFDLETGQIYAPHQRPSDQAWMTAFDLQNKPTSEIISQTSLTGNLFQLLSEDWLINTLWTQLKDHEDLLNPAIQEIQFATQAGQRDLRYERIQPLIISTVITR